MNAPLLSTIGAELSLSDFVVAAVWLEGRAVFATGDAKLSAFAVTGERAWERESVHDGGLLAACAGFQGDILTSGDDGRVVSTDAEGASALLAHFPGAWIEALAASKTARLAAAGIGKEAAVLGADGEKHRFAHDATVEGLAFEPSGRRLAAAHYGGATVSWAASPESRRKTLAWKGAHLFPLWSKDGKFLVTSMQENALHGWRLQDGQHFRMAGYPTKIRALSFSADGKWLASAGAQEVVLWPFRNATGPMGQNASVAGELAAPCTAVACHPERAILAAGGADGEVVLMPLAGGQALLISEASGSRVTALAWSDDGRYLAFGCESGRAGVLDFTDALGA